MKESVKLNIYPLRSEEISTAVGIHQRAFPGFFLSFLGPAFLSLLYRFYIKGQTEIALSGKIDGKIVGILLGTVNPRGFYKRLAKRYFPHFSWASLKPLVKKPAILPRLMRALFYRGDSPLHMEGGALLSSVCVDPDYKGKNVGEALVLSFEDRVAKMGAKFAYLTTDSENNKAVNNFYEKLGWTVESEFITREGRAMRRYWKKSERLKNNRVNRVE